MYKIIFDKVAYKQLRNIKSSKLDRKLTELIDLIQNNPYQYPPDYEPLKGDKSGLYSRRINYQHRLVYQVYEETKEIYVISCWSHYEY